MDLVTFYRDELQALLTFLCGFVLQLFFLFLPVDLKNWHDDLLNVITYLAVQGFSAGVLFFFLPEVIGAYSLSWGQGVYLFLVLSTLALLRSIQKIPLERSYPVTAEIDAVQKIVFGDLYTEEKSQLLEAATTQMQANMRVERIRAQLVRVTRERSILRVR
jgi:multidrug transporter EmrE-like cation transporter